VYEWNVLWATIWLPDEQKQQIKCKDEAIYVNHDLIRKQNTRTFEYRSGKMATTDQDETEVDFLS
jgi:hypothetical protein